jgi:hypothetical protein
LVDREATVTYEPGGTTKLHFDCWAPGSSSGTGQWSGVQTLATFTLKGDHLEQQAPLPFWVGEYRRGSFVDVPWPGLTRFFVPWVETDSKNYYSRGALITY